MNDELLASLKVNTGRLMEDIHYSCQWGTGERWGEYVHLLYFSLFVNFIWEPLVFFYLSSSRIELDTIPYLIRHTLLFIIFLEA